MKFLRTFILLALATACRAASVTGSGTVSFYCWSPIMMGTGGPETEVLSSSSASASLNAVCPVQPGSGTRAVLNYSASYGSLSIGASSGWFAGDGAYIDGQDGFSDEITVEGPASGFLVVSGEANVSGGTDSPASNLGFGLSVDGQSIMGGRYTSRHGVLNGGTASSIQADFIYFVPFTAGTPMTISGVMDVHTGGIYLQGIGGSFNVRLSVVDNNRDPADFSLQSESGFVYDAPEPESIMTATSALLACIGAMFSNRRHRRLRGKERRK